MAGKQRSERMESPSSEVRLKRTQIVSYSNGRRDLVVSMVSMGCRFYCQSGQPKTVAPSRKPPLGGGGVDPFSYLI